MGENLYTYLIWLVPFRKASFGLAILDENELYLLFCISESHSYREGAITIAGTGASEIFGLIRWRQSKGLFSVEIGTGRCVT